MGVTILKSTLPVLILSILYGCCSSLFSLANCKFDSSMRNLHAEWWLGLARGSGWKNGAMAREPAAIGVLTFEVASLMSKAVALWHSLGDEQILRLSQEVLHLEGVRKLVSDDDDFLMGLVLTEMMDSLTSLARSVVRLGKRCADPVLQRFEHHTLGRKWSARPRRWSGWSPPAPTCTRNWRC